MRGDLLDTAFGSVLVVAGVLIAWFAATRSSPVVGALGAVYVAVGVVSLLLQQFAPDEPGGAERERADAGADAAVTLSSAPEFVREDLPASSKLVWLYLASSGESTLDEIVAGTQLSPRTARNAITRLEKYEAVSKRPVGRGTRQLSYGVDPPTDGAAADDGADLEEERRPTARA